MDDGKFRETYSILSQTVEGSVDLDRIDAFRVARDQVARLVSLPSPMSVVDFLKVLLSTRATLSKEKLVTMNDEVEWLQSLKDRVEVRSPAPSSYLLRLTRAATELGGGELVHSDRQAHDAL